MSIMHFARPQVSEILEDILANTDYNIKKHSLKITFFIVNEGFKD
jgi:ribosomal protein L22